MLFWILWLAFNFSTNQSDQNKRNVILCTREMLSFNDIKKDLISFAIH